MAYSPGGEPERYPPGKENLHSPHMKDSTTSPYMKEKASPTTQTLASYGRTTSYGADFVYSGSSKHAPRTCLPAFGNWEADAEEAETANGGGMKTYSKQFSDLQRERYKKKRELKARRDNDNNLPPDSRPGQVASPGGREERSSQPEASKTAGTAAQPNQGRVTLASLFGFRKSKTAGANRFPNPEEASWAVDGASEEITHRNIASKPQYPHELGLTSRDPSLTSAASGKAWPGPGASTAREARTGRPEGHFYGMAPWQQRQSQSQSRDPSLTATSWDTHGGVPGAAPPSWVSPGGGGSRESSYTSATGEAPWAYNGGYARGTLGQSEGQSQGQFHGQPYRNARSREPSLTAGAFQGIPHGIPEEYSEGSPRSRTGGDAFADGYEGPAGAGYYEGFASEELHSPMDPQEPVGVWRGYQEDSYQGVGETWEQVKIPPFKGPAGLWQRTFSVSSHVSVAMPTLHTWEAYTECAGTLVRDESATAEVGCCVASRRGHKVSPAHGSEGRTGAGMKYSESEVSRNGRKGPCGRFFGLLFGCFSSSQ